MRRRRVLLMLAGVALLAGVVLCWPRGRTDPIYEGKRLSRWIEEQLQSGNSPDKEAAARKAVRSVGTNSLPYLMSEFTRPQSKWRSMLKRRANSAPGIGLRLLDDRDRAFIGTIGLYHLGPDAAPALPTLAEFLGDLERGNFAAMAMCGAGDLALPYLLKAITVTNTAVVENAFRGLQGLANETETTGPALVPFLQHTNCRVRINTAAVLSTRGLLDDRTVPTLARGLSDPDPAVRFDSVHFLMGMRERAKPAVPELLRLMKDSDPYIAKAASNVVAQIDPSALPRSGP